MKKIKHLLYVPFTGLGLYGGYRGRRWFRNRLKVFKQFVIPSLLAQTSQNYILWISFIEQQKKDKDILELKDYLDSLGIKSVFTFSGCCFWDDKYPDEIARLRLINALHGSMGELINVIGECDYVYMTIQPSDDCYHKKFIEELQREINPGLDAIGFKKGYIMDYKTLQIKEYNPKTNPPFFTIKFPREIFIDPLKHIKFTGPYKSHEYIGNFLKYKTWDKRGFLVGIHGCNISTVFDHPYAGETVDSSVLKDFGLDSTQPLKIKFNLRNKFFNSLSYGIKRKLRYWSEKTFIFRLIYNWLRG